MKNKQTWRPRVPKAFQRRTKRVAIDQELRFDVAVKRIYERGLTALESESLGAAGSGASEMPRMAVGALR